MKYRERASLGLGYSPQRGFHLQQRKREVQFIFIISKLEGNLDNENN